MKNARKDAINFQWMPCWVKWQVTRGRRLRPVMTGLLVIMAASAQGPAQKAASSDNYVKPNALNVWERALLGAAGDRFQVPGKERFTLSGQLVRSGSTPQSITITREFPDKIRIDRSAKNDKALVVNASVPVGAGTLSQDDKDLLESLYADSPDLFFAGKGHGVSYRLLGGHVRADDGSGAKDQGPWYMVYQLALPLKFRDENGVRFKNFVFDASTGRLEGVRYEVARAGRKVAVAVQYSGWQTVAGQAVPGAVRRSEDGIEIWRMSVTNAVFTKSVADNAFSLP